MDLLQGVVDGHDDLHLYHVPRPKVVGSDAVNDDLLMMHLANLGQLIKAKEEKMQDSARIERS